MWNIATTYEIIERKGAWYHYAGQKWNGKDPVLQSLREDLDLRREIDTQVRKFALNTAVPVAQPARTTAGEEEVTPKPWEKQEKKLAARRNGSRQPGSGSGWRRRNDVREGRTVLWEAKQTSGVSISVKASTWSNLRKNALMEGMMPALALRIGTTDLVVISQDDFDEHFPPTT